MEESGRYPNRLAGGNSRAATPPPEFKVNWENRPDPKKFDFAEGSCLVGVLLAADRTTLKDPRTNAPKPAVRYTVRELEDVGKLIYSPEPVFFHGTYVLDSKLSPRDVGHFVSITCKGEDRSAGRSGNPMKLFDVNVSKETAPGFANDGTAITDDDLPPMDAYKA